MNRRIASVLSVALLVAITLSITGCGSTNQGKYFKNSRGQTAYMYKDRTYNPEDYRYQPGE